MECVVIEFFKVMSTVLHTPLVFILFTTIFADSRISYASLAPITTSVVFHIVFVKILSNHFLDAVLDHLICNMRMTHHNPHFPLAAIKSFSIFLQSKSGSPNRLTNTPTCAKQASTISL